MKRGIVYLLIVILFAGWLGTLIAKDPGYVLLSYDGASLQTSLWVMAALVTLLVAAIYYLLQLINFIGRSSGYFQLWREERQKDKSGNLTAKGFTLYEEGDYIRAERFLASGAAYADHPAVNLMFAARAANAQEKAEERERYLREARVADPGASHAIAVVSAELAMDRGEWRNALEHLANVGQSDVVIDIKVRALLELKDWQQLFDLMPQLKRTTKDATALAALQKRIALERLSAPGSTDEALAIIFRKLPDDLKRDAEVVGAYCARIAQPKEAEVAIRQALKQQWDPELVALYGRIGEDPGMKRLKAAEGWLKQHADDAALQLCLGELYEMAGEKEKAKAAFLKSVDLRNSVAASVHLGRILAFDGDYKKSHEVLSRALKLKA